MKNSYIVLTISLILLLSCSTFNIKSHDYSKRTVEPETAFYTKNWDERKLATLPSYQTSGLCGGFPKINIKTAPGFCLGLLDNGEGMIFPRTALEMQPGKIVIVDMGGWKESNGKLYLLSLEKNKITRTTILDGATSLNPLVKKALDRPHLMTRGPDQKIYLSSTSMIVTLDPLARDIEKSIQIVIDDLPNKGLHPLKVFTFDDQRNIFVNVGSATNVCKKQGILFDKFPDCSEVEDLERGQAQVRKYFYQADGSYSKKFSVYSKGLRNSMGLLWNSKLQALFQAENGRDNISEFNPSFANLDLPHEELNLLKEGQHFGWPYCYDNNQQNPEWTNIDCSKFSPPYVFLPAHSAPLSLLNYQGSMFPTFYKDKTLISLHGYESRGHRIILYNSNTEGYPTGQPLSLVYGWDAKGSQALGSPVGLSELLDGSIVIVEDKSRKVLRLFYDSKLGDGKPIQEIPEISKAQSTSKDQELKSKLEATLSVKNPPLFAKIQNQMIDKHCIGCHAGADARGLELAPYDFVENEKRILRLNKQSQLLMHLKGQEPYALMPPDGFKNFEEQKEMIRLYTEWLTTKSME